MVVQLPVQLLVLCMNCENGLIPPYTILLNVPQWRWARRNVCRLQATNHGQRDLYFSRKAKSRRMIYNWPVYGGRSLMNKGIRCMNKWVRKGRKERWNEWMNEWMNESFKHSRTHSLTHSPNHWIKGLDDWSNKRINALSEEQRDEKVN